MSNYALIIIAENNYINNYYAIVCLISFLDNNKWFDGDIVFFEDDECNIIDDKNKDKLRKLYHKVVFKKINFDKYYKDICNNVPINEYRLYHAYPKFEVFNLKEYNKILCVDGDILFNGSVEELFKQDIAMGVTSSLTYFDKNIPFDQVRNIFDINECMKRDSAGFNSGVMYFGNNDLINEETYNQLINFTFETFVKEHKLCPLFDQHILNEFFKTYYRNQITWLSPIYNMAIYTWDTYIKSKGKYLNYLNTDSPRINEALDKGIIFHLMSKNDIRLWANDRVINLFKKYICQITQ